MSENITGRSFDAERSLYHLCDAVVSDCRFEGPADGESALKESRNVTVERCSFQLRYPLWHSRHFKLADSFMSDTARAPIWYAGPGEIVNSELNCVKAVRECSDITLRGCKVVSPEFGWKCKNINIFDSSLVSEYFLLELQGGILKGLDFKGKYSFQYTADLTVSDSVLDTKDAFWHSKNITVRNCKVKGEYLGWYSDGLTLIDCEISGTQPLCYCTNLTLINCTMTGTDLSFEYSDVSADIRGDVLSVKNPKSGKIVADSYGDIILEDSIFENKCEILTR